MLAWSSLTVTLQVAVLPPSSVVTVMVAVPFATPVTLPLASTVAMVALLDAHVTFLLPAWARPHEGCRRLSGEKINEGVSKI